MFVSIVTVNYNGKRLLKDFLESTFALDYPSDKYEVIVVDNASTDGSVSYIKNRSPRNGKFPIAHIKQNSMNSNITTVRIPFKQTS